MAKSDTHKKNFIDQLVRKEIFDLPRYNAGLPEEYVLRKYNLDTVIRLASNENPFGAGLRARQAVTQHLTSIDKYSDPSSYLLRDAIAQKIDITADQIVMGNGSEDLICLLCRAVLRPGDRVVTVEPSFMLHEIYPLEQGADVVSVKMTNERQFDIEKIIAAIQPDTRMLIFSNPSNPVGSIIDTTGFTKIVDALSSNTLLVIDEAYYEYAKFDANYPDSISLLKNCDNPSVILRTFSKAYGLAGLRVGYGLFSHVFFADQINKLRTPFNVNSIGQAAALAALADREHLEKTIMYNLNEKQRLTKELQKLGITPASSHTNFLFFDCGQNSIDVAEKLLQKGIIIKPWTTNGYQQYLRVTLGSNQDNDLFMHELRKILEREA